MSETGTGRNWLELRTIKDAIVYTETDLKFKDRTINALADMICGNTDAGKEVLFPYRSRSYITRFFLECATYSVHHGTTLKT